MAAAMPNGRIEVLPDTGHLPWIDYPDQVADLVRRHVTYT
jgi:pimeloyl-ACP methyl ester carboxylesterase